MFEKSSTDCAGAKILGQPGSSLYFLEEVRGPSERGCQNRIQLTSANQASKQKQASQDKRGKDIQNDIMWLAAGASLHWGKNHREKREKVTSIFLDPTNHLFQNFKHAFIPLHIRSKNVWLQEKNKMAYNAYQNNER